MDKFKNIYNDYVYKNIKPHNDFYDIGIDLIINADTLDKKEDIIYKLLNVYPNDCRLCYFMGVINKQVSTDKALYWFKRSYEINPEYEENILDLTKLLFENNNFKETIRICNNLKNTKDRRILLLMGTTFIKSGQYNDAINILEKTINGSNDSTDCYALQNLGILKNDLNLCSEAIYSLKKAYDISTETKVRLKILGNILITSDYIYFDNDEKTNIIKEINKMYKDCYYFSKRNNHNSRRRIGYVSSDFTYHAVANFILPILENHDRTKYDIILYSTKAHVEPIFIDLGFPIKYIYNMESEPAAKLIYDDKIDILIDLNGHTDGHRLDVFALNPAPIQCTYIGYPNTTGLKSMHYRLTDNISDNPESTQQYSEKLVYLPSFFLIFKSLLQDKPIIPRKTDKTIYLGSINKENKSSPEVLLAWKEIMKQNPNTKIIIKTNGLIDRTEHYKKWLDIPEDRMILMNKSLSPSEYLDLFAKIDILLDTFPYSGTTTTCNALYNSIPVITLYNKDYHSHNVSSSILIRIGYPELVSYSVQEYIIKANTLINDATQINKYKHSIHTSFTEYMNAPKFVRSYEDILDSLYS